MKYKVIKKQQNSKDCLVCGLKNPFGLKASFYEIESEELVAVFKPLDTHQSYPQRLHGGISAAILDETIGRAIMIKDTSIWGVTIELELKYRKPVPLNEELKVIGRITKDTSRIFEGTGEIVLSNGDVAVTASGRYMKLPIEKIAPFDTDEDWKIAIDENDPKEIEIER